MILVRSRGRLIKFFPIKRQEREREGGREGGGRRSPRARQSESREQRREGDRVESGVGVFVEENINMGFIILWRSWPVGQPSCPDL